jgi:hypothetical protein
MSNTSLADSYLKLSGLDSALSKLVSEFAAAQLQSLGANSLKNSLDIFQSSLSAISQLASDITITPELQKALDSLISSIGSSVSSTTISAGKNAVKEILAIRTEVQPESTSDAEYVIIDNSIISDFDNATDTFPIDSKHSKITFDRFLSLLNTVLAIIALVISLRPSTTEQEQLALQRTEIKILSEILENTEAPDATTVEKLDKLQESVDEINSHLSNIEQYQKVIAEPENNESTSK